MIGTALAAVAARSLGAYVLVRQGKRHGVTCWKVNARVGAEGQEITCTGRTLARALARAAIWPQVPEGEGDG